MDMLILLLDVMEFWEVFGGRVWWGLTVFYGGV
jgi:hypothetical protein